MPVLISVDEFRERFDISDDIEAKRITPHIGSASRRLRKWVGETVYAQASDVANNETTDLDLVSDLKNAEAHLAFHYAIAGFNSPLSPKGVLATATSTEGREVRRYLNPDETAKLSIQFLELAREIAEPYMLSDGTPASSFEVTDVDEYSAEATTRMYGVDSC